MSEDFEVERDHVPFTLLTVFVHPLQGIGHDKAVIT
jgi:hypothetical protein